MLNLCASLLLLSPAAPAADSHSTVAYEAPSLAALYASSAEDKTPANFSYTFLQLGYSVTDIDGISDDSKGLTGRASIGLFDLLYVFLDYSNPTTDYQNTNVDQYGLGAGVHFGVMEKLDLVGEAAWLSSDISSDLGTLDDSNDGWTAMAGARWMPLPWDGGGLELNGGYRWIDLKSLLSDEQTGAWEAGARYSFLESDRQWGVDARVWF